MEDIGGNSSTEREILRLQVRDTLSNKSYLVDTGADVSVLPLSSNSSDIKPTATKLYAANGSSIKVLGERRVCLDFGLPRKFYWTFLIADVTSPIIGADFLRFYDLLIDLRQNRLIDNKCDKKATSISFSHLNALEIKTSNPFADILNDFSTITQLSPLGSITKSTIFHRIETEGQPVHSRARRLSPEKLAAARAEFDSLMKAGICQPSSSNWSSPLHMVRKSDGSWRPCGDYRALNARTLPDRYPLPYLTDFTSNLSGMTIFSKIDLKKAFHQVPIHPDDVAKTAIITPFGLFEFKFMTFGLCNAAQTFQRLINEVFRGLEFVFPYIDDICVASRSLEEHRNHLRAVFQRLKENNLAINLSKCEFGKTQLSFLGHLVDSRGIYPLPEKIEAVRNFPKPTMAKELKRFIGMINFYRKFLPHAVKYQSRLQTLIRGNIKNDTRTICWTQDMEDAFLRCKEELAKATLLVHPVKNADLALFVDASDTAVGAALHQCVDGCLQPLGFYSKKLTSSQRKYSAYDRELTAIYQGVSYFRYMIEGRKCYVVTDHRPLIYAFQQKLEKASPRRARQLDFVGQFTTDIRHIPGTDNVTADFLSRIQSLSQFVDYKQIAEAQRTDNELLELQSGNKTHSLVLKYFPIAGSDLQLLCDTSTKNIRPFIPTAFRQKILSMVHGLAHSGVRSSTKALTSRFVWPSIRRDCANFVRNCIACQRSKIYRHTKSPISRYMPPKERFSHINIDIVGPFPLCEGQQYCLTIIDRFTRWPEAVPMPNTTAETVAKAILFHWIARFGVPARITSDRGRQFESAVFSELTRTIGAYHLRTTPYHPQSNGIVERWHRVFKAAILCSDPAKWVHSLPSILLGLRVVFKPDINASPAELVYGTTLRIPGEFFEKTKSSEPSCETVSQFRAAMRRLQPTDTSHHVESRTFVSPSLGSTTHVFIRNDSVRPSLSHPYDGPYEVKSRSAKYFKVLIQGRPVNISVDRLKPAFSTSPDLNICGSPDQHLGNHHQASNSNLGTKMSNKKEHTTTAARTQSPQPVNYDPVAVPMKSTRFGRRVTFPKRFR